MINYTALEGVRAFATKLAARQDQGSLPACHQAGKADYTITRHYHYNLITPNNRLADEFLTELILAGFPFGRMNGANDSMIVEHIALVPALHTLRENGFNIEEARIR